MERFSDTKYVGVQSWKAMRLPTLDIRVEQIEILKKYILYVQ